ncbi:MAG: helix-turn-helix domain containing protein [Clostridia bacterium]|nr:helix-turn-helix domain containing protein [Clostridia bacterium]
MDGEQLEQRVCAEICKSDGILAREIAGRLGLSRKAVNHLLYASPLLGELCWQDRDSRWHGVIRQERPQSGLFELCGYYSRVAEFLDLSEDEWMDRLIEGCQRIGRSINDLRGLFHSFRDCRAHMARLFTDLLDMIGDACLDWEIAFEFRLKRARRTRIYADVLVITEDRVFSLEFKMKDAVTPEDVSQAAKYCPYLEIVFGPGWEVLPALVLTGAREYFDFVPIGQSGSLLPVCSGDMLFNVFDEYLGFLSDGFRP